MMKDEFLNPWTTLSEKEVYENPWIKLTEYEVLNPNGNPGIYGVVSFKNLAIGVVALDHNNFIYLVGQYRYPLKQYSWEIPEGGGVIGNSPLDSAKRELLEETGLKAESWQELMRMHLSNSVSDELAIVYLATKLEQCEAEPEDTEELQHKHLPLTEAYQMVQRGEITDAISVAAIQKMMLLQMGQ